MSETGTPPGPVQEVLRALRADVFPGVLFAVALGFYAWRLAEPPRRIYDEVYHAYTASQYVKGNPDAFVWYVKAPKGVGHTWNHPPVGLWCIAGGIRLWGDHAFGWRFASAVFGALGLVIAYLLALLVTRRRAVAMLVPGLLLVDGLWYIQSRTSMLDIFGTTFMMAALAGLYAFATARPDRVRGPLIFTGLFTGLGLATKWSAAYPALLIGLFALWRTAKWLRPAAEPDAEAARRLALRRHLEALVVGLGVVPAVVYLAAYIPFFMTGRGLADFVELQRQIYLYHTRLQATHTYQSAWWQWPLALRPVWYSVTYFPDRVAKSYANGNPALYWAFVPAVTWLSVVWWRSRNAALVPLAIGFFGQWLPWMLVPRCAFVYHFLPAVPFGAIAVAAAVVGVFDLGRWGRIAAAVYLLAVVLVFAWLFPIYAALPLSPEGLDRRMWLDSWR